MNPTLLQTLWFLLFMVLVAGYAVLDGFDLGVGVLSLFRRDPKERRLMINAIGPVWDGNEVWLLTAGGALFAAFPPVYATVFSGFYLALILLLLALIVRAVSMEFRSKIESPAWQRFWDLAFGLGSLLPAVLLGVAAGNILRGIPIDAEGLYRGGFPALLNPFSLLIGLLALAMFTCHGANYMAMKTGGGFADDMRTAASRAWTAWVILYIAATLAAFFRAPHLFEGTLRNPVFWIVFPMLLAGLIGVPPALGKNRPGAAFAASSLAVAGTVGLGGVSLYPNLVPSTLDPAFSLTAANASSTERTLLTMLVIALIGMPIVVGYTIFVYRVFKGRVEITTDSY